MSSLITSYLTIAAMLVLITFPVLVPALITAVHAVVRRGSGRAGAARYLPTASRRVVSAA
ncbi:hypothetical protein [Mycobacterium sp. 94-17]|uniref:hypothetical protein n=1 Tax=Mycobacterium sp. 94-17 TaxID=2986147 RepID=UPI002D1F5140|nr:hypothetical protein [Mycobacterium sp. 94-17]MEB4211805.1 hypothetical protein [Mycobacterium sp. 94-17]